MYASYNTVGKRELWTFLSSSMRGIEEENWCLCGDFNVVRSQTERRGVNGAGRSTDMVEFNEFVNSLKLIDLPLERRKFTWYKDNGKCCSRLDRFLLSEKWVSNWPSLAQFGLKRKVSDHAAILLKKDIKDWGPRPFKFLSCWLEEKGFKELVEEEWKTSKVEGWSGYVLKEKLKSLKERIRAWHGSNFGNLDNRIEQKTT